MQYLTLSDVVSISKLAVSAESQSELTNAKYSYTLKYKNYFTDIPKCFIYFFSKASNWVSGSRCICLGLKNQDISPSIHHFLS